MVEVKLTVNNASGLHLRPARNLCSRAMEFQSEIKIRFRQKEFNAKSLLGLLSACVQNADEIVLTCSGSDEEQAAAILADYIRQGMDE